MLALIFFTSCGALFTSGKGRVAMNTPKEKGTTVLVNGIEKGNTPIQLKLKVDDIITFEKEEFETRTVVVDGKFNFVSILNGFNILGWVIDAVSGAF